MFFERRKIVEDKWKPEPRRNGLRADGHAHKSISSWYHLNHHHHDLRTHNCLFKSSRTHGSSSRLDSSSSSKAKLLLIIRHPSMINIAKIKEQMDGCIHQVRQTERDATRRQILLADPNVGNHD